MSTRLVKHTTWLDRRRFLQVLRLVVLVIVTCSVVVYPLWLLFINSAKPLVDANRLEPSLPKEWALVENYRTVISEGNVLGGLFNTLVIVVPAIALIVLLSSMGAWVFARRTGRGVNFLYMVVISGVILPPIIVTTIYVLQRFGLYGSRMGIIIFYVGALSSIAVFLITGFVKTIPADLEEAAMLDGARPWQVFWHVTLPLLRPILLTCSTILFLIVWNDLLYQFFLLGGRGHDTLTLGLYNFAQIRQYQTAWNLVFAYVILVSLCPVIVFVIAQRRIVDGLTAGALK